jgi:hypothetical protein
MSTTILKPKRPTKKPAAAPAVSGRSTDEVFARVRETLRTMTPAKMRLHMIKVGILDHAGNRIAPAE